MHWQGIIRHYGRLFTFVPEEAVVTLLEGNTPLIPAPASAASIAGVIKLGTEGFFRAGQRLVCMQTGHGLKDPDNAIAQSVAPVTIPPVLGDVLKILGF
jgi:threonine synthase